MDDIKEDDLKAFLTLAQNTDSFLACEIDVLKSVLEEYKESPGTDYTIFKDVREEKLAGFIIFGKVPGTEFAWDVYWLVVGKEFQGRKIGQTLLKEMEDHILNQASQAILRVETSGKTAYLKTRNFYLRCGFTEIGKIADFYAPGDDLVIYARKISKV